MFENLILAQAADLITNPIVASDDYGRIIYTNKAHEKLSGWAQSEIKGRNFKLVYDLLSATHSDKSRISYEEAILYKKDGSKLTLNATKAHLKHPESPDTLMGQIVIFHPLVPFLSEDLRSSDDFVSTVSHELRTPLTSIKGFAETIIQSGDKLKDHDRKRFLGIIKDQADHLTRLVEDLLFVSRLDNHKIHLTVRELEPKKYIDRVCEALSNQSGGRLFVYEFEPNLPKVSADSDRLEQILNNLLSNAIKYSPENTNIKIRMQKDNLQPNKLKISVIDQGVGINKDEQELIFNRFSRLDNPLTRNTKGTGLGLYITKSLVTALKGDIWLEKSDGKETVFSFTLPIAQGSKV
jgi:PAS domain S-box-containing protein